MSDSEHIEAIKSKFRWLLQRGADLCEGAAQLGAYAVDGRDDRKRNTGCDQSVFDSGGTGFVSQKFAKQGHEQDTR
jgi:hypothetical protein